MTFESSLSKIGEILHLSHEVIEQLEKDAVALSQEIGQPPPVVLGWLNSPLLAGVPSEQVIEFLRISYLARKL